MEGESAVRSLVPFPTLPGVTFKQALLTGITSDGKTGEATLQVGAGPAGGAVHSTASMQSACVAVGRSFRRCRRGAAALHTRRAMSTAPARLLQLGNVQSGETLAFDYALLATGSVYASGVKPPADVLLTRTQRLKQFADIRAKVRSRPAEGQWNGLVP